MLDSLLPSQGHSASPLPPSFAKEKGHFVVGTAAPQSPSQVSEASNGAGSSSKAHGRSYICLLSHSFQLTSHIDWTWGKRPPPGTNTKKNTSTTTRKCGKSYIHRLQYLSFTLLIYLGNGGSLHLLVQTFLTPKENVVSITFSIIRLTSYFTYTDRSWGELLSSPTDTEKVEWQI